MPPRRARASAVAAPLMTTLLLLLPTVAAAPLPLCTSCAAWCAGTCAFPGPPLSSPPMSNPRGRQNITLYRMTAANVTDLDDKDTGDPGGGTWLPSQLASCPDCFSHPVRRPPAAGRRSTYGSVLFVCVDLVFNMDERAIPLVCRHSATASTNPDCVTGNTHSWLLNSNLVYLQWVVEVDGAFGPYQMCNLNLTDKATGKPGDGKWFCDGARFDHTNFSDMSLCRTCAATKKAVGWCAMNDESTGGYTPRVSSATCNSTFKAVCGSTLSANYSACRECGGRNYAKHLKNITDCNWSDLCPSPPPASSTCKAAATELCGSLRKAALHRNCSTCLRNHSHELEAGPCPNGEYETLAKYRPGESGWCPSDSNWYDSKSNATWVGPQQLHPNHRLVAKTLAGSWFSTTAGGRCPAGVRPSDGGGGGGCTWRPVALTKAVNYSCVQANVAAPILAHGRECFAACADGHESNPLNPSVRPLILITA